MNKFNQAWCYEAVRLREQAAQVFDDRQANCLALEQGRDDEQRLLLRAQTLCATTDLAQSQSDTRQAMRMGIVIVWGLSLFAGVGAGLASLGDSTQPVNVIWAMGSLLLLPSVMLIVWLATFFMRGSSGGWIGRGLEVLAGKLLSKGEMATSWRAWLCLASRASAHRWWLAFVTHSAWFWVLTGMAIALALAFSVRHYTFVWQTTWLSEEVFVGAAQFIGALPAKLGFVMPDAQVVSASGNAAVDEPSVRLAWANWLLGGLLVFGWLPRLLFAGMSWLVLRARYARLSIDQSDAYAHQVKHKLARLANHSSVDAAPGPAEQWQHIQGIDASHAQSESAVVVLETSLPGELHAQLPVDAALLPPVDDRASREQANSRLLALKPKRLLIIADARQTPDRGVVRSILTFGAHAVQTQVYLVCSEDERARVAAWRKRLQDIGLSMPSAEFEFQLRWLIGQSGEQSAGESL